MVQHMYMHSHEKFTSAAAAVTMQSFGRFFFLTETLSRHFREGCSQPLDCIRDSPPPPSSFSPSLSLCLSHVLSLSLYIYLSPPLSLRISLSLYVPFHLPGMSLSLCIYIRAGHCCGVAVFSVKKVVFNTKNHECPALKTAFFWARTTKTT